MEIKSDESTKVLCEVVKQYCMANYSIFSGTREFQSLLDPVVQKYVAGFLTLGNQNGLCPAKPKMSRIVNLKSSV